MLTVAVVTLWALFLGLTVLVVLIYRQFGLLYVGSSGRVAMSGLHVGVTAPKGLSAVVNGARQALDWRAAGHGRSTLVIFGGPGCPLCARLTPALAEFAEGWNWAIDVWFIDRGFEDFELPERAVDTHGFWTYALSPGGEVHEAFDTEVNPFGYVISNEGLVTAKGLVRNANELAELVQISREGTGADALPQVTETRDEVLEVIDAAR